MPASIQSSLTFLLLAVIVPILVVQALTYYHRFQTRRTELIEANHVNARIAAVLFDQFIQNVVCRELSAGTLLVIEKSPSPSRMQRFLDAARSEYPAFAALSWIDPQGAVVSSTDTGAAGKDLKNQPWIREIIAGSDLGLGSLSKPNAGDRTMIAISRSIRDESGALLGTISADLIPEALDQIFASRQSGRESITIFDGEGTAVYSYPKETEKVWSRQSPTTIQSVIKDAVAGKAVSASIRDNYGLAYSLALAPSGLTGWVVVSGFQDQTAIEPIIAYLVKHAVLFLLITIPAFLGALALSRTITVPVKRLRDHALAIGRGDLNQSLDVGGPEELQELAAAFRTMANEISVRENALQETRNALETRVEERTSELAAVLNALRTEMKERERISKELRDQLRFLQTLIDTIPNPIFYKDCEGVYLGCNNAFEDRLCLRREDIIGKTAHDIFPEDLAEEYHKMDSMLFRQPGEQIHESSLMYADGRMHDTVIYKATFADADGVLAGLVGVTVDITDRKQAEEALRMAHSELEMRVADRTAELAASNEELRSEIAERKRVEDALLKSSESLKLFAYSVVHDLKSPAVGIYGLTRLLYNRSWSALDDKGKAYCEQIMKATEYLAALVEKINSYMASKEMPLKIEDVNMKEVLGMLREELSPQLTVRGIDWLEPDAMPGIRADRISMLRVFRNLVDNALKYGGQELSEVRIDYERFEEFHIFSVADNGIGVKTEDAEKIFGVFQRNEASRDTFGTGLGLAIVKEIVERHGGKVWVKPRTGRGTVFYFSILRML
jgi:PAS domain S-box-containing protein